MELILGKSTRAPSPPLHGAVGDSQGRTSVVASRFKKRQGNRANLRVVLKRADCNILPGREINIHGIQSKRSGGGREGGAYMCKVLFTPLHMYIPYYDVTLQEHCSEVSMVSLLLSTIENTFVLTVLFFLSPSHLCKMNHSWIQTDSEGRARS